MKFFEIGPNIIINLEAIKKVRFRSKMVKNLRSMSHAEFVDIEIEYINGDGETWFAIKPEIALELMKELKGCE